MKTYKVTAHYTVYLQTEIEAKSEEQAWAIAFDLDGSMFRAVESGDWNIDELYEVKE